MKKNVFYAALLTILSQAVSAPAGAEIRPAAPDPDGWKLVWQDNFEADCLNPERWNIEVNGAGGGNNELQFYTDRDVNVRLGDDGQGNRCLILTAIREEYNGRHFTSGRVNSKNRIAFTHGKIEAAIKLPQTANGLWPAFWMMGNDYDQVGWPRCGETDILEMGHSDGFAGMQDRYFNGAMHWGEGWPNASYAKATNWASSLQDGQFHIFTCVWDDEKVEMYLDLDRYPRQQPYYRMDIPCDDPGNSWSAGNYFHKDNFILFNLAVGGNFPGIHNPEEVTALNEENGNKAEMMIDYVRIYQRGLPGEHTDFADLGDPSGIDDEFLACSDPEPVRYYTLSGCEIPGRPENGGLYLERRGGKVIKAFASSK